MEQNSTYESDREMNEDTVEDSSWEPVVQAEKPDSTPMNETLETNSETVEQIPFCDCSETDLTEAVTDEPVPEPLEPDNKNAEEKEQIFEDKPEPIAESNPTTSNPQNTQMPDVLGKIDNNLQSIANTELRLFTEIREMHKLYHTEFAGRLLSMQNELEQYRKIEKGRVYDDILAAIARIYVNNETLAEEVEEPKAKKSIKYLLMDLEELIESYGMSKIRSNQGEKRDPRHCQIHDRIPTNDPQMHDKVAKSYNSGFHIGNRTVIKEVIDIYVYEEMKTSDNTGNTQIIDTGDNTVSE